MVLRRTGTKIMIMIMIEKEDNHLCWSVAIMIETEDNHLYWGVAVRRTETEDNDLYWVVL